MTSTSADQRSIDERLMRRAIEVATRSGDLGEYPYATVIARGSRIVCETINPVRRDRDVTRHTEVVAISEAQKRLGGTTSLEDCTLDVNVVSCAYCCYAIRESRIGRVLFGMPSPVMGGLSRWNILGDTGLSERIPEVFAPPPDIVTCFLQHEAEAALRKWNPIAFEVMRSRGIFGGPLPDNVLVDPPRKTTLKDEMRGLRRNFFDHFGESEFGAKMSAPP